MRKKTIIIAVLISIAVELFGTDIYVYNFNVVVVDNADPSKKMPDEAGIDRISGLFQKAFTSISSDTITFRTLSDQPATQITGTVRTITSTINALVVCFFYNIDYIIYGDVTIDRQQMQYLTHIKIYGKEQNGVIYELRYAKSIQTNNEETYVGEIAAIVNQQLPQTLRSIPPTAAGKKLAQLEEVEKKKREAKEAEEKKEQEANIEKDEQKQKEDKLITFMEKILEELVQKETSEPKKDENPKQEEKKSAEVSLNNDQIIINKEKLFGFYIGVGYFFPFLGKWIDMTMPLVTVQAGPKFNFFLVDTPSFDLYLRPGAYVVYSLAIQKNEPSYNQYMRVDSLAAALGMELCFEFNDLFGISIGGGAQYNFDYIIFRQFITEVYYSYTSNVFGAYGNIGLEFVLGHEKNIIFGINNIINFKFYSELYLDYRILACITFKV